MLKLFLPLAPHWEFWSRCPLLTASSPAQAMSMLLQRGGGCKYSTVSLLGPHTRDC